MTDQNFDPGTELPADLLASLRQDARHRAERPEEFWRLQQIEIHERIRSEQLPRPRPLRIALAGACIVFLAVLLSAPAGQRPAIAPEVSAADADQQLLVSVEHAIASGTPEALEPLTLLVESNSNLNDVEAMPHKEHHHED